MLGKALCHLLVILISVLGSVRLYAQSNPDAEYSLNSKAGLLSTTLGSGGGSASGSNSDVTQIEITGVGVDPSEVFNQPYADKINAFVRQLTPAQIREISPDDFGKIPPSGISLLSVRQVQAITLNQIRGLSGNQIMELNSGQIKEFFITLEESNFDIIYSQLTKKQMQDFILSLSPNEVGKLSKHQLSKLDANVFSKFSNRQFNVLTEDQITALTTSQVNGFTKNQLYWSFNKLTDKVQRANFIRILDGRQLLAIVEFLPISSRAEIFNNANPKTLANVINDAEDASKDHIIGTLNGFMVAQIYPNLSKATIEKLNLKQKAYVINSQQPSTAEELIEPTN